ncbi:MAG: hypothetical protein H7270_09770 [Dermatophilaceae bacterium]|nr:hypothetical protein [Dermatophilaceae bacterium]
MTPEHLTQPQPPGPAQVPPFAAMLRATVLPMVAPTPVIVGVCWAVGNARAGLSGLLGVMTAVLFFASGLYVMSRVARANPLSVLAGALAVYLGQVLFLGVVILSLSGADWLDGTSFGLSVLAVALIWQLSQVVAFIRLRKPVYDMAGEQPVPTAPEPSRARP